MVTGHLEETDMHIVYDRLSLRLTLANFDKEYEEATAEVIRALEAVKKARPAVSFPEAIRKYQNARQELDMAYVWVDNVLTAKKYFNVFDAMRKDNIIKLKCKPDDKEVKIVIDGMKLASILFKPISDVMPHLVKYMMNEFDAEALGEFEGELTNHYAITHELFDRIERGVLMFKALRFWSANRLKVS